MAHHAEHTSPWTRTKDILWVSSIISGILCKAGVASHLSLCPSPLQSAQLCKCVLKIKFIQTAVCDPYFPTDLLPTTSFLGDLQTPSCTFENQSPILRQASLSFYILALFLNSMGAFHTLQKTEA